MGKATINAVSIRAVLRPENNRNYHGQVKQPVMAAFHIIEMPYDTQFPTEPQNDLVPAQAEKNAEVRARYLKGEAVVEFVRAY